MNTTHDPRRRQLVRIHIAKKWAAEALGMDDAGYRALLQRVGGHASSAIMTTDQREAVMREFVRLGFEDARKPKRRLWPGEPRNCDAVPMLGKVRALLADHRRPWNYAHRMAEHMFGVKRVEWLHDDQLHRLISALQIDARRRQARLEKPEVKA